MRHSLRAVSLSWLIVLVPILAGSSAGADGNGRLPSNDARVCNLPSCAAALTRNKAPRARNDAAITALDTTVTINVTANDRDLDGRIVRKTVRIVGAGPRHGRAGRQRNGTVVYAPDTGFSGQDTFRYRVKDNRGALSNRARVQVTVLAGTRPPVANNDTAATAVNTPVVINVVANDTDADGNLDPRSVAIATNPASGGLVNRFDGTVTYTPSAGFFGTDAFTYTVRDARGATSNVATVTVAVNAGPVADAGPDQNALTGQPVTLNGSGSSNPNGNTLAFSWRFLSKPPTSVRADADIVNPASPAPSFTPDVDGAYELELRVTDGSLSDTDGVVITAATDQVPPNAEAGPPQSAEVSTVVTLNGSASNDPDNGPSPLTFRWVFAQVPLGSALTNANITNATSAQASFTPDVTGLYRLTLTVSDGALSDSDDVDINVTPANVPPNAAAGSDIVVQLGETATLNGSASDPDNGPNPLTFQWTFVSKPAASTLTNGAIAGATTATARFTPDVPGVYLLRLDVFDGEDTAFDQVTVRANAVVANVPPVANPDSRTTPFNTSVLINVVQNDTDSDGTINPASVAIVGNPTNGTATPNGSGAVTYTPTTNFAGTGSFRYTVNDNRGATSNAATVTITVGGPANVPPVANPDSRTTPFNTLVLINVVQNDTDSDGTINPASVAIMGNPANGTAVPNGSGAVTYTPNAGFVGTDSFRYTVNDNQGATSNQATVTITVQPPVVRLSTDVQPIFTARCAACHNGTNPPQPSPFSRPDLRAGNARAAIVNEGPIAGSACAGNGTYVVPGNPDVSLLLRKLGANFPCGSRMPLTGGALTSDQVSTIRAWIMQGALNN